MRKRRVYLALGSLAIAFLLGTMLVIPIFNKKTGLELIQERLSRSIETTGDQTPEPYIYEHFSPPENSFGIDNTTFKYVNWTYFKQLFTSHCQWMLEYKRYSSSEWTDGNQYLTIEKEWNESLQGWKFNLILDAPVDVYSARFTFACDLPVLNYVERDEWQVNLNYTIPNTEEVYNCYFNWSDMANIPNIIFTKGKTNDLFWFRFRRDNVPAGHYEFDPTFGNEGTGSSETLYYGDYNAEYMRFDSATSPSGTYQANSITFKTDDSTWDDTIDVHCAIYTYSSGPNELIAETETKSVSATGTEYTFNFDSPPVLSSSTTYVLAVAPAQDYTSGGYCRMEASSSGGSWYTSDYEFPSTVVGENDDTSTLYLYCTVGPINTAPTATSPNPSDGSYNESITGTYNITVEDGEKACTVDFYTSTDNSTWTHRGTNTSVENESVSFDYSDLEYDTLYYVKTMVNDTISNESFYTTFETTPYRTDYFNTTFNSENWVDTNYNLTFENSFYNATGVPISENVYTDDFEDTDGNTLTTDGNWVDGGGDYKWIYDDDGTPSSFTGANDVALATTPGTDYLFTEASSRASKHYIIETSEFTGGTNISLDFYYHMYGSSMGSLTVDIWDGSGWDELWTISGQQHITSSDAFTHHVVYADAGDSAPYTGTTKLRIDGLTGVSYYSDMCITYPIVNRTYASTFEDGFIKTKEIHKPAGYTWDKFYADVDDTEHCSFALSDNSTDYNITSGLVGNGDDISSLTNDSLYVFANFSIAEVSFDSFNITWAQSNTYTQIVDWNITISNTSTYTQIADWNLTLQNLSSDYQQIQDWNITLQNQSANWQEIQDWNLTLSNLSSAWQQIADWNLTLQNLSSDYQQITDWNITLQNHNSWTQIADWNLTLQNLSSDYQQIQDWNITLVNTSTIGWTEVQDWNITLSNTSTWKEINDWNITLSNQSSWTQIQDWNITLSNTSVDDWQQIQDWNITLSNQSNWQQIQDWNITLQNKSFGWKEINDWNITISNSSLYTQINDWNITLKNGTGVPSITITSEFPSDNTFNAPLQPLVYATVNHSAGNTMNVSFYYGTTEGNENTLLGTDNNVANGSYSQSFFQASNRSTTYYWRIQVDDGETYINETFEFKTEGFPGGTVGQPSGNYIYGVIGLLGIAILPLVLWKLKKKRDEEDDFY